jgi:hypothetical protein
MRKVCIKTTAFICFFFLAECVNAQFINKNFEAKIEIKEFEEMVVITGTVENLTDVYENLYFKLSVIKKGNSNNTSSNSQEGRFTIKPDEKKSLSKTQINIEENDKAIVLLLIYNEDDLLVGKDRVELQDIKNDEANNNDKGIEITGLVSDETKTKIGKDFYELYFKKYSEASINGTEIVTIEEELNFGRTTKIKVYISNVLISNFIAFPDEEFLQYKAEEAVLKTKKYFKDSKNKKRYVTQY